MPRRMTLSAALLLEGLVVTDGAVDRPHAAVANHAGEAPDAEALADQLLPCDRQVGSLGGDGGFNGGAVTAVGGEQGLDFAAQVGVAAAGLLEEPGPLRDGHLEHRLEDLFDTLPLIGVHARTPPL